MSADLAAYTTSESALDRLDREAVVALLERGKSWLDLAVARDTEIGEFVEFKGQAETVRVYTVQKQLGKDAELAAAELVRRAERGIGLAIRAGQQAGTVMTVRDGASRRDRSDLAPAENKHSTREFFSGGKDMADTYALTDGVTDEQFDSAISEAKAEGNLSRANVVRKVTGRDKPKSKRPEVLRGTHRIDSHRVIAATVDTAAANTLSKDLLAEIDLRELDTHDLEEWISSLSESLKALRSLKTTLEKELNQRA